MDIGRRDPVTDRTTTGHEWNGIEELNTPVPRVVLFFLAVTALFSLLYWILMPAWPLGSTYTKGLLGLDQREIVQQQVAEAAAQRAVWTQQLSSKDAAAIQADEALMQAVKETGQTLFADNCAVCHGTDAMGNRGFPNLRAKSWLWGGDPASLEETIRVGINSNHPESRVSEMPAFGRDGILERQQISDVADYLRSISDDTQVASLEPDRLAAGKDVFAANCSACHGEEGRGNQEIGAPDLTDRNWIYGGDRQALYSTVFGGRQGQMPAWEERLSPAEIRILALYVHSLEGGGQ